MAGANAARNAGIERARAPVVTFLDSDDVYLPDRLERTLERFDNNPSLEVLISSFVSLKGNRRTNCVNREAFLNRNSLEQALVAQTIFIAGSAITARRESLLAIGGYDSDVTRMQDRELLLRFARRSGAQSVRSDRLEKVQFGEFDLRAAATAMSKPMRI